MERNIYNSWIAKIVIKKRHFFLKSHFLSLIIYIYAKPFIHFSGRRGEGCWNVLIDLFFLYSSVSVESGPITAPYSQCQFVDHSNSVDQTDWDRLSYPYRAPTIGDFYVIQSFKHIQDYNNFRIISQHVKNQSFSPPLNFYRLLGWNTGTYIKSFVCLDVYRYIRRTGKKGLNNG